MLTSAFQCLIIIISVMKKMIYAMSVLAMMVGMTACKNSEAVQKAMLNPEKQEREFLREAVRHHSPDVQRVDLIGNAVVYTHIYDGIIDVKTLFGVESVKDTQAIDMCIKLEHWKPDKEYDRLGLEDQYTDFLGNKVICHNIPIRPGRNVAIIVEAAAVNHRQKKMGYNAAQELYNRVQASIGKNQE